MDGVSWPAEVNAYSVLGCIAGLDCPIALCITSGCAAYNVWVCCCVAAGRVAGLAIGCAI